MEDAVRRRHAVAARPRPPRSLVTLVRTILTKVGAPLVSCPHVSVRARAPIHRTDAVEAPIVIIDLTLS